MNDQDINWDHLTSEKLTYSWIERGSYSINILLSNDCAYDESFQEDYSSYAKEFFKYLSEMIDRYASDFPDRVHFIKDWLKRDGDHMIRSTFRDKGILAMIAANGLRNLGNILQRNEDEVEAKERNLDWVFDAPFMLRSHIRAKEQKAQGNDIQWSERLECPLPHS